MRLELPFAYRLSVKSPRSNMPVKAVKVDFVEVDIPEMTEFEAPVALEWDKTNHDLNPVCPLHVRSHGGRFYTPLELMEANGADRHVLNAQDLPRRDHRPNERFSKTLSNMLWARDEHDLSTALQEWYAGDDRAKNRDVEKLDVISSTLEMHKKRAEGVASSLITVDGQVYVSVPEPRLCISTFKLPFPGVVATVECSAISYVDGARDAVSSPASRRYFRAGDLSSFYDEIEELGGEKVRNHVADIRIQNEAVFEFDRSLDIAVRTAAYAHQRLATELAKVGRAVTNGWHDIDEAITAYAIDGDRYAFEDGIMAGLVAMAPVLEGRMPELASELRACVDLWSSSAIELNIDAPSAGPRI